MRDIWFRGSCPNCGHPKVQQHSLSAWCLKCGWAKNRRPDPRYAMIPWGNGSYEGTW